MSDELSDILPVETDVEEEGDGDGLEIDERQSKEIRQIFGTTLPQYLEPVEEMIEQILSSDADRQTTMQAFVGTVSSLSTAAARMGFDEVYQVLDRMNRRVSQLAEAEIEGPLPEETREAIVFDLDEIKELARGLGGADASSSARVASPTIFSVLRNLSDLDENVVQKLSAAGVVTVDQVRGAGADELMAVTGLSKETVERVMEVVAAARDGADDAVDPLDGILDTSIGGDAASVITLPLEPGSLRAQLMDRLQAQVDVEADLDEVRTEVQRLRRRGDELRSELQRAQQQQGELQAAVREVNDRLAERIAALARVRASQAELTERAEAAEGAVKQEEARVLQLRSQRQAMLEQREAADREVAGLVERVQRMIRLAARG